MVSPKPERNGVFISYSHKDAEWLERLRVHLRPFERDHNIEIWHDRKIRPGSKWIEEIQKAVESAKVAVLLISADFLGSDFIATVELPSLLNAAENEGAVILPVIVSPASYLSNKELSRFQSVNDPSNPLIKMTRGDQEALLVEVTEQIKTLLDSPSSRMPIESTESRAGSPPRQDAESRRTPEPRARLKKAIATIAAGIGRQTGKSGMMRRPVIFIPIILLALAVALLAFGDSLMGGTAPRLTGSGGAMHWYSEGMDALRDGMYDRAENAFQKAAAADDDFVLAHVRLAEACVELDYFGRARRAVTHFSALTPDRSKLPRLQALYIQAINDTVDRNFENAIKSYQEITRRAPKEDKSYAYMDLGRAYERNEDVESAIENYLESTSLDPYYAAAHVRLGILYGRKQNIGEAIKAFDTAEEIYSGKYEGVTEVHYQRGILLNNLDRLDEAQEQFDKALALTRTTDNDYQRINILLQLSSVAMTKTDMVQAQKYAQDAINLSRDKKIWPLRTRGLIALGDTFYMWGKLAEAEKSLTEAIKLAEENELARTKAKAQHTLGGVWLAQHKADQAMESFKNALAFYELGGYSKEVSLTWTQIGAAHLQKDELAEALQIFERVLEQAQTVGDKSQEVIARYYKGMVLALQERYPDALSEFSNSSDIYKQLSNPTLTSYSLTHFADVLWRLGRYDETYKILDEASSLLGQPDEGNNPLFALVYQCYAEMALSQRKFDEALKKGRHALDAADKEDHDTIVESACALALAQVFTGAKARAKQSSQMAIEAAEQSHNGHLVSMAKLALAEVLLESGDGTAALNNALAAKESFARIGQPDSEWRMADCGARQPTRTPHNYGARICNKRGRPP